jgi:hypothetical protein
VPAVGLRGFVPALPTPKSGARTIFLVCHPEQREGSWFLPAPTKLLGRANTKIPRFARDDTYSDGVHLRCHDAHATFQGGTCVHDSGIP